MIFLATMGFLLAIAASKESPKPSMSLVLPVVVVATFDTDSVPIGKDTTGRIGVGLIAAVAGAAAVVAIPAEATAEVKTVVGMASPAALRSPEEVLPPPPPPMDVIISSNAFEESHDLTLPLFPSSASSLLRLLKIDIPGWYRIRWGIVEKFVVVEK